MLDKEIEQLYKHTNADLSQSLENALVVDVFNYTNKDNLSISVRGAVEEPGFYDLKKYSNRIDIYDPWVNIEYAITHYDFNFVPKPVHKKYDAVIIATAHSEFKNMSEEEINLFKKSDNSIIFDIKSIKNKEFSDLRL